MGHRIITILFFTITVLVLISGCTGKGTVFNCEPRQSTVCEDDHVFWLDSCGNREANGEACPCACDKEGIACETSCQDPCEGITCDHPPESSCADATRLRTWTSPGICSNGQCTYEHSDEICENGCEQAACQDEPCEDISCDQPPEPICMDEGLIRTFDAEGRCEQGQCIYDYHDDNCTDCCYGAEINPTGEPIGGGKGYRDLFSPEQAQWVASDTASFLAALDGASSGETIYVQDSADIDLTGYDDIQVQPGLTIASGRGRDGSLGALIWTSQFDTFPLFMVEGENVRFSGIRIMGPDQNVGDHDYDYPVLSRGIQTGFAQLEVDNCEISGFGHGALVIYGEQATAHVHHCYIHNNTRAGLGYGVVLSQSHCLIEANLFDSNRHSIAGTGRPGTSYEARYNLVLAHATGHYFDMHGAADFDKNISSAIWRFNEGQGDLARDTSVFHSNDCSLVSMDTELSWVTGEIGTGLFFDGLDDHLQCGHDESLVSDKGSIEFWLRLDRTGQEQELLDIFEDESSNYLSVRITASDKLALLVKDDDVNMLDVTSDDILPSGVLTHLIITQDGTGAKVYINGQETSTSGTNSDAWSGHLSLSGLWIGAGHHSALQGLLDEVRIYSRALDPDEVQRHFMGQADIAGGEILIHHNTFRGFDMPAITIRGVPSEPSSIHHNWFADSNPSHAVRQTNAQGNLDVTNNHYGPQVPVGTRLPYALGEASPDSGSGALEVSFDASASHSSPDGPPIINWLWKFGDGESAWGSSAVHTYTKAGRYGADLTVFDAKGSTAHAFIPVLVSPGPGTFLDFWAKDSYRGPLSGYYAVQALVDGDLVWEKDVSETDAWQHVSVDISEQVSGKQSTEVELKVLNRTAVLNKELIELSVYFDDVYVFGADQSGGDFEGAHTWAYDESSPEWSGYTHTEEARSGWRSLRIQHPYNRDCQEGSNASISQTFPLRSQHLLADWRLDEGHGVHTEDRSVFAHHGTLLNMDEKSWVPGTMGRALEFDGIDDSVGFAVSPAIQSDEGTIDFWLSAQDGSSGTILSMMADDQNYFSVELDSSGFVRIHRVQGGASIVDLQSDSPVDDGETHYAALVQDGAGPKIFIDGVDSASGQEGNFWTTGMELSSVRLGDGPKGPFAGKLDEVRIDDRAHDGAWVQQELALGHLVGQWHFDEGQGLVAPDSAGDHDGSFQGMDQSSWVEGIAGQALLFHGQDDYLDFGDVSDISSPQGSIEFWFRPQGLDENQDILNIFEDGYENYLLVRLDQLNRIYLRIEDDDVGIVNLTTAASIHGDYYHHLVVTQDGFGVRIYMDGVPALASGQNSGAWTQDLALTGMWLGRGHWSWFNGAVDELVLYARALRPQEISDHFSQYASP